MPEEREIFNKEEVKTMKKDIAALKQEGKPSAVPISVSASTPTPTPTSAQISIKPKKKKEIVLVPKKGFFQIRAEKKEQERKKKEEERKQMEERKKAMEEIKKKQEQEIVIKQQEDSIRLAGERKKREEQELKRRQEAKKQEELKIHEELMRQEKIKQEKLRQQELEIKKKEEEKRKIEEQERVKREEIEKKRKEAEEKTRKEAEEKRKLQDPLYQKELLLKEKEKLESERAELEFLVIGLEREKRAVENEKSRFLSEISGVEKSFKNIISKEGKIEEESMSLEEKEALSKDPSKKRRIEKERWGLDAKRREIEKKRWPLDEKIIELEKRVRDFDQKQQVIEEKQLVIRLKEKDISKKEQEINLKIEKIDSTANLQKLKELKNGLVIKKTDLLDKASKITSALIVISAEENKIEQEKKNIDVKEKGAKNLEEKKNTEKQRWEIEEKREKIESERWQIEKEKEEVDIEIKKTEEEIQSIVGVEQELINKIKEADQVPGLPQPIFTQQGDLKAGVVIEKKQIKEEGQVIQTVRPEQPKPQEPQTKEPQISPKTEEEIKEEESRKKIGEAWKRIEALKKDSEEKRKITAQGFRESPSKDQPSPKAPVGESDKNLSEENNRGVLNSSYERRIFPQKYVLPPFPKKKSEEQNGKDNSAPQPIVILKTLPAKPSKIHKLWVRFLAGGIIIAVLAVASVFLSWYFLEKEPGSVGCVYNSDCPRGFLCGSDGLCLQETTSQKCSSNIDCPQDYVCGAQGICLFQKKEAVFPEPLFVVEEKREISIPSLDEIQPLISQIISESMEPGNFKYITIKNTTQEKISTLKDFIDAMQIRVPAEIYQGIKEDEFTLFIYSQVQGNRIGFAAKIKDKNKLSQVLLGMEPTIKDDFKPFFNLVLSNQAIISGSFKNAKDQYRTYEGPNFRFRTLTNNDIGIVYLVSDDYFIFTSSWESILKTIERLDIREVPPLITKNLSFGITDKEVETLQVWLAKDPLVYPEKRITGYFGPATRSAVVRFQEKYFNDILAPQGITLGTGVVDLLTRTKLNALYGRQ